jgi:hypothetical protein
MAHARWKRPEIGSGYIPICCALQKPSKEYPTRERSSNEVIPTAVWEFFEIWYRCRDGVGGANRAPQPVLAERECVAAVVKATTNG